MTQETIDLVKVIVEIFKKSGFDVSLCDMRSCYDMVAKRGLFTIIVKVLYNVDSFSSEHGREMKKIAYYFNVFPLIVGYKTKKDALEEGVVYSREDIPVISVETLENILLNDIPPLVYSERGGLYVKIDGKRLKREREKRGLSLGYVAAVGMELHDHTYELIAYRERSRFGKKREIDVKSVIEMDKKYYPLVFDNYDYRNKHLCIAPNSPCPVLYGIRGESPEILEKAQKMIKSEKIDKKQIFLTNQGTDMHLVTKRISEVREFDSVILRGEVSQNPVTIEGGHVIFRIRDEMEIFCAAYEPTKEFRDVIRKLIIGDIVRVYGGVKYTRGLTVNLEKIEILKLAKKYEIRKRKCECGGTLKSKGKGVYRCKKCGKKVKLKGIEIKREIKEGFYEVPPSARRHLSKPLCRYQKQQQS